MAETTIVACFRWLQSQFDDLCIGWKGRDSSSGSSLAEDAGHKKTAERRIAIQQFPGYNQVI